MDAPSGSLLANSARTGELNSGLAAALPRRPDVGDEIGTDCLAARGVDAGFDLAAAGLLEATCDTLDDLAGVLAGDPRFDRREVGEDMLATVLCDLTSCHRKGAGKALRQVKVGQRCECQSLYSRGDSVVEEKDCAYLKNCLAG